MTTRIPLFVVLFITACCPPEEHLDDCAVGGTGTIVVTSTGLPAGVTGTIHLTGASAQTVTSSQTLSGIGSGPWSVTADRATDADPLVRTVYLPTVTPSSFCLANGATQDVIVTWAPVATSNALWAVNSNTTGQFLGFKSANLRRGATVPASVVSTGGIGADVAFDRDGNVWAARATVADTAINRYPSAQFAASGAVTPDVSITLSTGDCSPLVSGLAFDASGNLYVASPCHDAVYRFDAAQLVSTATVTPALTISVTDPAGIAFDRAGNLWVVTRMDSRVWRYDAAQLSGGSVAAPAFKLGGLRTEIEGDTSLLVPSWIAFDARGDLWVNDFAGNLFFRVAASETRGTGTLDARPQVRITIGVLALLEGFAFDGEGGLWSAGAMGTLFRLAPVQLDVSSGAGAPTVPERIISSGDIGSASNVAFYPAPAGLPLYSSLP